MTEQLTPRSGGRILVDQLRQQGVDHAFAVPGESYLAVLDALYDTPEIALTVGRQEGGVAMMAEAYGKLTGRPGICFVTRGPGATNASAGVHIAFQDSTPMILFIGQVGRDMVEREAFQEIDYRRMFGQLAKWVAEIDDAARIPEFLSRAFHTAVSGRPGPVVLALPEDMLRDVVSVADVAPFPAVQSQPDPKAMALLVERLESAQKPLMIVGGGGWNAATGRLIETFAEAQGLPIAVSFRCQDYIDNRHPNYVGHVGIGPDPVLAKAVDESDLLLVVGARLGEMTTGGYQLIKPPIAHQPLVHVHSGAEELGRVYRPELPILASQGAFAAAASALPGSDNQARHARVAELRQAYLDHLTPSPVPGPLQMGEIVAWLCQRLPDNAILTNGAGNYASWLHRYYLFRDYRTQLAPTSGSMGYGTPAAVAAKAVYPDRPVVCFAGDGCFMMHGQELATAVQYGLNIIILVINNAMFGTIRMHQERDYPERVSGTNLVNPDFVAYAKAFGAYGELVEETAEFGPAFERALAAGRPAILELRLDPEVITPKTTLSAIRKAALNRA